MVQLQSNGAKRYDRVYITIIVPPKRTESINGSEQKTFLNPGPTHFLPEKAAPSGFKNRM